MTGNILLTRFGIFKFSPILNFWVEFDVIQHAIQTENYLLAIGLFRLLPKMFKSTYVIGLSGLTEIKSLHTVKKLIKKLEEIEGELSEDKKQEILDVAEKIINKSSDETISESIVISLGNLL